MKRNFIVIFLCLVFSSVYAEVPVVDYSTDAVYPVRKGFTRPSSTGSSYVPSDRSGLNNIQRIKRLERQIDNINRQDLLNKIEELQRENQTLSGKVEFLEHQNERLSEQLKDFYNDMNQRLDEGGDVSLNKKKTISGISRDSSKKKPISRAEIIEEASVIPVAAGNGIVGTLVAEDRNKEDQKAKEKNKNKEVDKKDDKKKREIKGKESITRTQKDMKEQQMYQTAIDLLPEKKHESRIKLRAYLKKYPNGAYVANAYYWLGEINYLERDFDAAEEEFKIVVDKYSNSRRAADAMLKLALVHQNQGKEKQAKKELNDVIKRYPGTPAAHLAKQQLTVE